MQRLLPLLFLLTFPLLAQFPPVRWAGGTAAPAGTACDASTEVGSVYVQDGNPATVVGQVWSCRQIGASTYAWHPINNFLGTTLPTTCTNGQMAVDSDATSGQRIYVCETSTWVLQGDGGGAVAWSALTAPGSATTFVSNGTSETVDFDFQANYTTGSLFNIRTTTGTPSGSTLLNIQSHDADVLVLRASGNGTGGITVTQTGILTTTTNDTAKAAIVIKDAAGVDTLKIYAANSVAPDTTIPSIRATNNLKGLLLDPGSTGEIRMFNTTAGNLILGAATRVHFGAGTAIQAPVDGNLLLTNNALTTFGMLQLGDDTAFFPAIKRSAASLAARRGDDSASANIIAADAAGVSDVTTRGMVWNEGEFATVSSGKLVTAPLPILSYSINKASATTWTVTGATHNLATCNLIIYTTRVNGTLREEIFPDYKRCETASGGTQYDVTVGFTQAQAGRILLNKIDGDSDAMPLKFTYRTAICQAAAAALGFSTPTSNPAVAACVTGSNTQYGVAQFADSANLSVQDHFVLPSDWNGVIDVSGFWRTSATTGDVVWQIATTCVTDAETGDPAFNSASTITDTAKGTTLQFNSFSGNTITVTGCAAGEELFFKLSRDSAHGSDTLAATADLITVTLNVQRII